VVFEKFKNLKTHIMKSFLISVFTIFLLIKSNNIYAQTIFKSWVSNDENVCMVLKKGKWSRVGDIDKIKCRIKDSTLTLIWINNQLFWFIWERQKFHYQIIKLTDDSLVLTQDTIRNNFEYLANKIIYFNAAPCK
jgi:hypothetical protein